MLETSRPLSYVSAQLLHFFQPILAIVADTAAYDQFTLFLEQRGAIDYICQHIESAEARAASNDRNIASTHEAGHGHPEPPERHGGT